jgi:putative DNA primase/helicase
MAEVAVMDDDRFDPLTDDEREQGSPAGGSAKDDDGWELISPIPDTVPSPNMHHWILGEPAAVWTYRDANGGRVCFIGRYKGADGKKAFRPGTWCKNRQTGKQEWRWKHVPPMRPLYGLELLAQRPNAPVIVVEGEKCADVARWLFPDHVVVSPMNGARSPQKTDWKPLKGRHVIIWPDHDKPGKGFVVAVAGLLKDIAASICVVDVEKLIAIEGALRGVTHNPDGWDVADAVLEWETPESLRAAVLGLIRPFVPTLDLGELERGEQAAFDLLIERCKSDPLCVLADKGIFNALKRLSQNPSKARAWETLRAFLKGVEVDVPALNRAIRGAVEAEADKKPDSRAEGRGADDAASLILPPPGNPMQTAREFVARHAMHAGTLILHYWRDSWWEWDTTCWREVERRFVVSRLYTFTEHAVYWDEDENGYKQWAPTRHRIANLAEALSAICILRDNIDQPCWLDGSQSKGVIVACANGLLELEKRELRPHSPLFFNLVAVPFPYDPNAPSPAEWMMFLQKLWPGDNPDAEPALDQPEIHALGEWFGYVISGRLDLHKILLMIGPTRGGKGIIARILGALIGPANVAGPTLSSLGGEFGLAPLIGKVLAIVADARFAGRDNAVVVERLLSISGEDTLTVNRKFRDQWTGKLPCRLHVLSNEMPRLGDASAAIIGRMVLLVLTHSWLGKEDFTLEERIQRELPGILNWALDGLHRLTVKNGNRFTRLPSAEESIAQMRDLASPIGAFVREECDVGAGYEVEVDVLYGAFKVWAENNGHTKSSKQVFGRDLHAAVPSLRKPQQRGTEKRRRVYSGIRLKDPDKADPDYMAPEP